MPVTASMPLPPFREDPASFPVSFSSPSSIRTSGMPELLWVDGEGGECADPVLAPS